MQAFFRNPEIKRSLLWQILLYAGLLLLTAAAESRALPYTAAAGLLFILLHYAITYRRYQKIRQLSEELEAVLHRGAEINFESFEEGELSILSSELKKIIGTLYEQGEQLKNDKLFLSDSLADISHQLRTPLTTIHLLLDKLGRPDLSAGEKHKISGELYRQCERIDWLVNVLLKISKIDAGTIRFSKERISLRDLLAKSLEPLALRLDLNNISLDLNCQGFIEIDSGWTAEALGNILKNCSEQMRDGGVLHIDAFENPLYSEIRIRDEGPGIAPEDLPHVFERFYKGKNSSSNSVGIGLALARMIVRAQNGSIKAENHPEGGALFTLRFYKSVI